MDVSRISDDICSATLLARHFLADWSEKYPITAIDRSILGYWQAFFTAPCFQLFLAQNQQEICVKRLYNKHFTHFTTRLE
jgi:hypothetical protein